MIFEGHVGTFGADTRPFGGYGGTMLNTLVLFLTASENYVGIFVGYVGPFGGRAGTMLGSLGLSWRRLKAMLGHLEAMLAQLDAVLALCSVAWDSLGGL